MTFEEDINRSTFHEALVEIPKEIFEEYRNDWIGIVKASFVLAIIWVPIVVPTLAVLKTFFFIRRFVVMGLTKKVGIGVGLCCLLGGLIFGRDFFSYSYTAVAKVRESVKSNVPITFEIERAKEKVRSIVPEIQKNLTSIAREEQSLENLSKQIASLEDKQASSKADMLTLQGDLEKSNVTFVYSERNYTRSQVEIDLAKRLERYQTNAVSLETMQKTKTIREKSLDTARQKLQACMSQKRDLEVALEQLASRLKMIELQKTTSSYAFDDSAIGDAKKTIQEIQSRLSVEEKLIGAAEETAGDINLNEQTATENIAQKVKSYFSGPVVEKGLAKE